MKKLIAIMLVRLMLVPKLIAIMLVGLMLVPMVRAEIIIDNSTFEILEDSTQSCFKDSKYGLWDIMVEMRNVTYCNPFDNYTSGAPSYCKTTLGIWNPSHEAMPVAIQMIPAYENLPCPAPTYQNNDVDLFVTHRNTNASIDEITFDLNRCWEWWCNAEISVSQTECPFGWKALQWLGPLGGCRAVNATVENSMDRCPIAVINIQPDDYKVDLSWDYGASNDVKPTVIVKIKGYTTGYRTKIINTTNNRTLSTGVSNYISGMETILNVNMNILGLFYLIFEIIAIVIAILGIPTLVIVLIRWVWETVTGRPFGFPKRKRR